MIANRSILSLALLLGCTTTYAQQWAPKQAPLMTRFAADVRPDSVLPEYPRPQLHRQRWMNLNGLWSYQPGKDSLEAPPKGPLAAHILVPFPVESALSGVMEHHERLWYKRSFVVPRIWKGSHVVLHFGAVDYESEVFINGRSVGKHQGGYDPFSFDITAYLKPGGPQDIMVKVYDPTDAGGFPRGKQSLNPQGIMYTPATGIWQTVWLEPLAATHVEDIHMVPDIDRSELLLHVGLAGSQSGLSVRYTVRSGDAVVGTQTADAGQDIHVPVVHPHLWSPDDPYLYDLDLVLLKNGKVLDSVSSYFGMRKISLESEGGYKKLYLNNHFLFELGPLDQGFWPDGIYTAPTEAALKYDLQTIKDLGFNMVRKHIKVEPYRWYYWADKLGLLIWQDMPSANSYTEHTPPVDTVAYSRELRAMVHTHWNSPSIIMWDIFNEAQGQHRTKELVDMVHDIDPSRLINQASGGNHFGAGDVLDIHSYPAPACPSSTTQALACGEYGGIGYKIQGHLWKDGFGYVMATGEPEYLQLYGSFAQDLTAFKSNNGLSAAVYTQTTDVETELNGLMTYDRAVIKAPVADLNKINQRVIRQTLLLSTLLPTSEKEGRIWRYTLDQPGSNWFTPSFDDHSWPTGLAGFGRNAAEGITVRTPWSTADIWTRQTFFVPADAIAGGSAAGGSSLMLSVYHDEDCEIYINGVKAASITGYNSGYGLFPVSEEAQKALIPGGINVIAVHCHQTIGGQYIDAGLLWGKTE